MPRRLLGGWLHARHNCSTPVMTGQPNTIRCLPMTQHWQLETLDPKGSASDGGCLLGGSRHSRHDCCTALSRESIYAWPQRISATQHWQLSRRSGITTICLFAQAVRQCTDKQAALPVAKALEVTACCMQLETEKNAWAVSNGRLQVCSLQPAAGQHNRSAKLLAGAGHAPSVHH